ncbi:MAG: hypothetical protein ACR2PA_17100 [Hyphomicrobiaceae bacterium]
MVEDDDKDIAAYYGIWPTIIGLAIGASITIFMFALADGFTS